MRQCTPAERDGYRGAMLRCGYQCTKEGDPEVGGYEAFDPIECHQSDTSRECLPSTRVRVVYISVVASEMYLHTTEHT